MPIQRLVASIPTMSDEQRRVLRENAQRGLGQPEKASQAQSVLAALDAYEVQSAEALRAEIEAMPVVERIIQAFRAVPLSETERTAIQSLLDNPGSTSAVLSERAGWRGQAWHLRFGLMVEARRHRLWAGEWVQSRKAEFYSGILADYDGATGNWTMKPEAAEAFAAFGLRARPRAIAAE